MTKNENATSPKVKFKSAVKIHPGEMLNEIFLKPLGLDAKATSELTGLSLETVEGLLNHTKSIDKDIAKSLSKAFENSEQLWLNLQKSYEAK